MRGDRRVATTVTRISLLVLVIGGLAGMVPTAQAMDQPSQPAVVGSLLAAGELVGLADAVVLGSPVAVRSYWSPDHGMIYTAFRIRIQDVIDGTAGSTLELTAEGGSVGETTLVVSNFPTLAIGETYLLLVGDLPGRRCVLGGARGAFLMPPPGVSCEAITPRAVATVRTIRKAAGR